MGCGEGEVGSRWRVRVAAQDGGEVDRAAVLAVLEKATVDLQEVWDECVAELDLTLTQLRVLVVVDRYGPLRLGWLADELNASASPVSKVVDRLKKGGYVTRTSDGGDERAVMIALSPAGTTLAQWIHGRHRTRLADVIKTVRPEDLDALAHGLSAFHRAAQHRPAAERRSQR